MSTHGGLFAGLKKEGLIKGEGSWGGTQEKGFKSNYKKRKTKGIQSKTKGTPKENKREN